jgi:hypothetical protein
MSSKSASMATKYPIMTGAFEAKRKVHCEHDLPALLLQTKSVTQDEEDALWERLVQRPIPLRSKGQEARDAVDGTTASHEPSGI